MDFYVAVRAILESRRTQIVKLDRHRVSRARTAETRRAVMAFQAHSEYHRPAEEP